MKRIRLAILCLLPIFLTVLLRMSPQSFRWITLQQEADWAISAGYYDLAATRLSQLVIDQPWRLDLLEKTGRAFYKSGNKSKAIEYFEKSRSVGSLSNQGVLDLADLYESSAQNELALEIWLSLLESGKFQELVFPKAVTALRAKGDLIRAHELLVKWAQFSSSAPEVIYQLALMRFAESSSGGVPDLGGLPESNPFWKSRREAFNRAASLALVSDPIGAYRFLRVGRALGSLGEWDLAAVSFSRALGLEPNYAEALAFLGEARQNLGQDGLADLKKAQQINPDSVVVKALFSLYWRRQGQPQVGLVYLQSAAQMEPEQAIWQVELGNTLAEMGDLISAMSHFQEAVRLEPESMTYWMKLAEFCIEHEIELNEIGIGAARKAVLMAPESPQALVLMGRILLLTGDLSSAERFLQRAVDQSPEDAPANYYLGQVYWNQDKQNLAYEHLVKASRANEPQKVVLLAKRMLSSYFNQPK